MDDKQIAVWDNIGKVALLLIVLAVVGWAFQDLFVALATPLKDLIITVSESGGS